MKITVRSLPPSKNKYMNWCWQARGRYKKTIRNEIWYEMTGQNIKAYKTLKKAKIIFKLYFKTNRRRDSANYAGGGIIAMLDSLVDLGIIKDDNYKVIGDPIVELYVDKDDPRTVIEISSE